MKRSLCNVSVPALLCAVALGCRDRPEPQGSEVVEPAPASIEASETSSANDDTTSPQDAETGQFVVYFGSFRDYLAAATYSESLRSAGLLQVNITRAKGGGEMLVTDPMDENDAKELAESLGGRLLSVDSLQRMTENYGFLAR